MDIEKIKVGLGEGDTFFLCCEGHGCIGAGCYNFTLCYAGLNPSRDSTITLKPTQPE